MPTIHEPKRVSMDECEDIYPQHPTDVVMACSPDPVLTHDGQTSQACRRCRCGRALQHVDLCNRPEAVRIRRDRERTQARVNARPLSILDLLNPIIAINSAAPAHEKLGDHWYWCRAHQRAEHVGWAMDGCVRIGPFMTEDEAGRLAGAGQVGQKLTRPPLGMEVVEQ